jgi:hypothetical protein
MDAENISRKCKDQFQKDQQNDDAIATTTVLTEALLSQQKLHSS